jgi:hypothetical protein
VKPLREFGILVLADGEIGGRAVDGVDDDVAAVECSIDVGDWHICLTSPFLSFLRKLESMALPCRKLRRCIGMRTQIMDCRFRGNDNVWLFKERG